MSTNRTLRILLVFLAAVCTHCAIAAPSNTASEPNLNQIQAAFDAEVRCELSDPIGLLAELPLAILSDMQSKAMHADATELNLLISNDSWLLKDYVITRQLRQGGKFDLAEVYRQDCSHRTSSTQRRAISQLKIADAVAKADFAWVPLLGNGNEYLGPGLVFVRENNQWRYLELVSATLGSTAKNRQLVQELRTVVRDDADDIAEFIRICNMPKAPQPKMSFDFAKAYQRDISAEIYGDTEFDPKNALGALQRTAVRRHAEGKQVAPSAVAQLLFAEVLIRSLEFASAPSAATPQWLSRVTRAQQFFEQAHARGADLASFLPLIPWLADVNLQGSGTHPIDLSKAQQLYKIAAAAGNTEAAAIYAHFQTTGFAATPVDCAGALELLQKNSEAFPQAELALESALVISQCADLSFREKHKSQLSKLLDTIDKKYLYADDLSQYQALRAFIDCSSSAKAKTCVAPPAKFQPGLTETALTKANLAGQTTIPDQAYRGSLPDAPVPETISCD